MTISPTEHTTTYRHLQAPSRPLKDQNQNQSKQAKPNTSHHPALGPDKTQVPSLALFIDRLDLVFCQFDFACGDVSSNPRFGLRGRDRYNPIYQPLTILEQDAGQIRTHPLALDHASNT